MGKLNFTPEDVAMGAVLQPAWYKAEITKVEDGVSKSSGKPKITVTMKVLNGKTADGSDAPGIRLMATFSPEYPSFALNFVNALGAGVGKEGKQGVNISNEACQGKTLEVYVQNDQYQGRTVNKAADYRKV